MKIERKLAECFEALTIEERVDAMLRAWKSGAPEDPLLRRNVPREQRSELATLLALVRAVCGDLGPVAVELGQATTELATRLAWLQTMESWARSSRMLAEALLVLVAEPLTETEHARRLAELRNEPLTSDEALDIVCQHRDCDPSEATSLLDGAVRAGQLDSSGEGKRVAMLRGDLYTWLKVPLEVVPDLGARGRGPGGLRREAGPVAAKCPARCTRSLAACSGLAVAR